MYTALLATSQTLADFIQKERENDPNLRTFFNAGLGGTMIVSLRNPEEMSEKSDQGLSLWLYRITRDEDRLNDPPERMSPSLFREPPLPLRLHYLYTPVVDPSTANNAEIEQRVQLHGRLGGEKLRPREHRQAQIDGGRVQSIDGGVQVQAQVFADVKLSCLGNEPLRQLGVDPPVARLVGIGQCRAPDRVAKAHVVGVVIMAEGKGVLAVEPAHVDDAALVAIADGDHDENSPPEPVRNGGLKRLGHRRR